ncbi:MAG: 16S rRNA (guanine(966)-N(2))-methyltransferase RsmD [Nitrospirota bacterium]
MRVIAGSHKGRRLLGPGKTQLRPTSDRVKEALFAILGPTVVGARFLDLYAGTGAIGIEALSRGARLATFVERHQSSLRILRANLARCGLGAAADVRACSAGQFFKQARMGVPPYDFVFADPPYGDARSATELLPSLSASAIISSDTTIVLEHSSRVTIPPQIGRLSRTRQYRYGDTTLSVFRLQTEEAPAP